MYEVGFRGGFFTVVYLPLMVSGLAVGYMAVMMFAKETGTGNFVLEALGIIKEPLNIYSAPGTAFILPLMVGWRYAGYNMAIFLSGLLSIPAETIESSVVDGAGYLQRLFRIYFPQMWPSFILATTMCLIGSFSVFDELIAMGATYVNPNAKFLSIHLLHLRIPDRAVGHGDDAGAGDLPAAGPVWAWRCSGCSGACNTRRGGITAMAAESATLKIRKQGRPLLSQSRQQAASPDLCHDRDGGLCRHHHLSVLHALRAEFRAHQRVGGNAPLAPEDSGCQHGYGGREPVRLLQSGPERLEESEWASQKTPS